MLIYFQGTYADEEGSTWCNPCRFNHFTYFDGSENEEDCIGPLLVVDRNDDRGESYNFR